MLFQVITRGEYTRGAKKRPFPGNGKCIPALRGCMGAAARPFFRVVCVFCGPIPDAGMLSWKRGPDAVARQEWVKTLGEACPRGDRQETVLSVKRVAARVHLGSYHTANRNLRVWMKQEGKRTAK
jgi:hypothetical protein